METADITVASLLAAPADVVWAHATTPAGVNRELWPLVRMTFPRHVGALTPDTVPLRERICRSWVLLFGVLPVDYDDLTLVALAPGRFLERSTMLSQRRWEHERTVTSDPRGCRVTDRVCFEPRVGALKPLYRPIFRAAFALRHRNLRRLFGPA